MHQIPLLKALKGDRWVKPFLKRYKKTLVLAISLGILTFISGAGLLFTAAYLISRSAQRPENVLLVYIPIVLTRAFGIARPVFRYFERILSHSWVFRMTSKFRQELYDSLESDAVFFTSKYRLGDVLGLLSEDIHHIQNLYLRTIFPLFVAWGLYALIVVCCGIISPILGLMMLVMYALILFAVPYWSVIVNGARQQRQKELKNLLYADLTDNVMGVNGWILAGRGQEYVQRHQGNEKALETTDSHLQNFNHYRDLIVQLIYLAIIVVLLCWSAVHFGGGDFYSVDWMGAFVLAAFPMIEAFSGLPDAVTETNIYVDSIKRLNDLPQPEKAKQQKPVKITGPYQLRVNDVHFQYPSGTHEILKGLSLDIQPGEKLAILGRSGSGKTTLANLIRGDLKPTSGSVTLNDIQTSRFGDSMANYIGVISQSTYLFNTTVGNNIRIGNEDASEEEVWAALDKVGLREKIEALPQGLDTKIDSAGLEFSGGERHRLSLTRILLKDTPIVLLDEPTVGLDPITEQHVIETFIKTLQGKTLIWITHHLQGISYMDQVVFVENGRLDMNGSPDYLQKTNNHYRQLRAADEGLAVK